MRHRTRIAASLLALVTTLHSGSAYCQTDEDRAGARAAAMAGATAMDEGKWQQAIDLFQRAEELVHAPPHLLYIARANVKLGRFVRAHETYRKIVKEELPANAPRAFRDARANALEEIATIEARLASVKVVVTGKAADTAVVWMDGHKLAAAMNGVPVPIDPGVHAFKARTRELESAEVPLTVAEGAKGNVTLDLRIPLKVSEIPKTDDDPSTSVGKPPARVEPSGKPGLRTAAFVSFGVAGIGAVLGTVFLFQNRSSRSDANDLCTPVCPESSRTRIEELDGRADRAATGAFIAYGVTAASVVVGGTLFYLSTKDREPLRGSTPAKTMVRLAPTPFGAVLHGTF